MISFRPGEVAEHVGVQQVQDRDRLLVDHVDAVAGAGGFGGAGVDMRRHVQLAQLLIERVPVAVAQGRRLAVAAVLVGVGVQQAADEVQAADAALEFRQHVLDGLAGALRQGGHAAEPARKQRHLAVDEVVHLLHEPVDDLLRPFAVHQVVRPRRQQLHVQPVLVQ